MFVFCVSFELVFVCLFLFVQGVVLCVAAVEILCVVVCEPCASCGVSVYVRLCVVFVCVSVF